MVKLPFNFDGYIYQEGICNIKTSYDVAYKGLFDSLNKAQDNLKIYQSNLADGGDWVGEYDENGHYLWDQEKLLEMRIDDFNEALLILRHAFVLVLYHYWETSALRWINSKNLSQTKSKHLSHDKLERECKSIGYPIDDSLCAIRDLANYLKHNNEKWKDKLHDSWSELFDSLGTNPTYFTFPLTDNNLIKAFNIVRNSGPGSTV